jgi:NADH-quinone oxidoreductase subunit H
MLAEYAGIVVLSALTAVMFLGGWYLWPGVPLPSFSVGPIPGEWVAGLTGFAIMFGKIATLAFVMIWFRATFPRLREDQLQRVSWLVFIPLAILNIVVTAIFKVVA